MEYVSEIPRAIPAGKILVHNHVRPQSPLELNGFRAWLTTPGAKYEACNCGWAPALQHFRVKRFGTQTPL
jgi:hypothetical protein